MKELIICKLGLDGALVVTEPSTALPQPVLPYLKTLITLCLHDLILHPVCVIISYCIN